MRWLSFRYPDQLTLGWDNGIKHCSNLQSKLVKMKKREKVTSLAV